MTAIDLGGRPSWGTEGAGRVVAVGSDIKHLREGDRTLVPFLHPAWAERIKTDAPWRRPLPPGDVNQVAMLGVNPPTAYRLLTDIVKLPPGSWVIQNAGNSSVGRATIAIAKPLGLRTVNVVRRDEAVAELKALGGDVVVVAARILELHPNTLRSRMEKLGITFKRTPGEPQPSSHERS